MPISSAGRRVLTRRDQAIRRRYPDRHARSESVVRVLQSARDRLPIAF
jgi:hypothetical protein